MIKEIMRNIKFTSIIKIFLLFALTFVKMANSNAGHERFSLKIDKDKVSLEITLASNHKIYWIYTGQEGQATSISLKNSKNLQNYTIVWPFPLNDKMNKIHYHRNKLSIPIYLEAEDKARPVAFDAELKYLICGDQCIPIVQNIQKTFLIPLYHSWPMFKTFEIQNIILNEDTLIFQAVFKEKAENPEFIVNQFNHSFIENISVTPIDSHTHKVTCLLKKGSHEEIRGKIFEVHTDKADLPTKVIIPIIKKSNTSIFIIILFGILGGLILNFMPCVLPILSLKIFSIIKQRINKTALALNILGIFSCFQALALITIILKKSGQNFGLGVNFQYPEFIIFLSVALTFYISSALGRLNINLPNSLNNFLINHNFKNRYIENFFNGIISVLLSTSCTAPYIGSALVLALVEDNYVIFIVFSSIAIGFSVPYFLLLACPRLLSYIPKKPEIVKHIKTALSLLLLLTLLWLLNVLHSQIGFRPTLGFVGLLLLLKFTLESSNKSLKNYKLKLLSIILIIIACFTLPKMTYTDSLKNQEITDNIWRTFDISRIQNYIDEGKIIVVDISADWCITCKYNKFITWENPQVKALLSRNDTIAMRGDYTGQNDNIHAYLRANNAVGIPFSKVYSSKMKEGITLPILLSPSDIFKAIKKVSN